MPTRRRPAGPPARQARAPYEGVGRSGSAAAARVSDDLRRGKHPYLTHRRAIAGLTTAASAALAQVGLYQFGLLRKVPEPRLPWLGADRVDASPEAYELFRTPDAALGMLSSAATLALVGMGDRHRSRDTPWVPLAAAAKTAADAVGGLYLFAEQVTQHRKICSWCTVAALAQVATLPLALPEARAAWRTLRHGR